MASIIHCIPMGFMHIGGRPILFSSPGVQTHSFVPLTKIVMVPSAAISATVAFWVTCSGPERRALVILGSSALSIISWPPGVGSLGSVSFRPDSSKVESPDRAAVWPEPVNKAAAGIVVARNSLRVAIDAHSFSPRFSRRCLAHPCRTPGRQIALFQWYATNSCEHFVRDFALLFDALVQRDDMVRNSPHTFSEGRSRLGILRHVNGTQFFDKPLLRHSQT